MKQYHKLVRDRIPEIIEADGKTCICETLSDDDYITLLDQKLNEELLEYQESKSLEELADLLEVMQAVVKARGWTLEELEKVRAAKAAKRGGFGKKILLKEVCSPSDYQVLALKILNNQNIIIEKIPPQMLNTYYWLQDNLHLRNVARDLEYRRKFAGYYRMRFVSQQYRDSFFSLFEAIKNDPDISFVDVARQLSQVDGRHEFSFISKMLHTIDPSRPIYDSRAWFEEDVEEQRPDPKSIRQWNQEYYVSFGSGERSWTDAQKYGFISAGGGAWYSNTLKLLSPGDRVWVNIPHTGYVGVGIVRSEVQQAKDVQFTVDGQQVGFSSLQTQGDYLYSSDDPVNAEYVVQVDWLKTIPETQAVKEIGFFGNQNSVCRPRDQKWVYTVERLKKIWGIEP